MRETYIVHTPRGVYDDFGIINRYFDSFDQIEVGQFVYDSLMCELEMEPMNIRTDYILQRMVEVLNEYFPRFIIVAKMNPKWSNVKVTVKEKEK